MFNNARIAGDHMAETLGNAGCLADLVDGSPRIFRLRRNADAP